MVVLIPAYQPNRTLLLLLRDLAERAPELDVVVVDDGSGADYAPIFAEASAMGADVIGFTRNRGKGAALKYGFVHVADHYPDADVVCADSDGQHRPDDILAVARAIRPGAMVLGVRAFAGPVPVRSRVGNAITRWAFRAATGVRVSDTQTGLRGYPAAALDWLAGVPGDRFEYELNLLLRARGAGWTVEEVPIETVYLAGNASSHFRPVADSVRIYLPLLAFSASSLIAFGIDVVALLLINALTGSLLVAVVGARALSSLVNFMANRRMVFRSRGGLRRSLGRYYALAAVLLLANYGLLSVLTAAGVALVVAKLLVEVALFLASYQVQRSLVFAQPAVRTAGGAQPEPVVAGR
ncbi:bifunctional glycosyltransferase family 2/GtrA family protein [Micropruina sonneratiae]|uniref:bifunctional glycosyltransferase family 2/GtrA family protein n=1 Tax=Micropruina sonneratiae TaxID=2986940 RepID=UPI0022275921|nr:bifunctional glycosyltransferase family 2/GtrA family protein [Micropruina sp. KQZ13P-5]MCW3158867.1 bifunctional glycosyltransferase family 2/GtrA family protein [Micropruina sp. KQZ13P-5]